MRSLHGRITLLILVGLASALLCGSAQAQSVVINGTPLVTSRAPVTIAGSMLLPMRDVFEALGSEVKWFAAERKIMAVRGQTVIELWIGHPTATINGIAAGLPLAPTMIDGSTYVPLRFPAEAFGGTVKWDPATKTALIEIPEASAETPVPPATPGVLDGTVIQVVPAPAGILLQTTETGALVAAQVNDQTVITRGQLGAQPVAAKLADARPGDLAQVTMAATNVASRLVLTYGLAAGKIVAIAGNTLVLEDGTALRLSDQVKAFDASGNPLPISGIAQNSPGQVIFEPRSKIVWEIRLTAATPTTPTVPGAQPQINTVGLLNNTIYFKRGSVMELQLKGTPGGQATVTVGANGRLVRDLVLPEVAPGTYQSQLTLAEGQDLRNQPIVGNLTVGGKRAESVMSQTRFVIDSTPPVINRMLPAAGQIIGNVAPVIQLDFQPSTFAPLDPQATKLIVNRRDVSAGAVITEEGLTYQSQNLTNGPVTVEAIVRDLSGNQTRVNWVFTIGGTTNNVIEAVWYNAPNVLAVGSVITVNARVVNPGGVATFTLGNLTGNQPMTRVGDSDAYRGSYTVRQGNRLTDGVLTVYYGDQQGRQGTMEATGRLSINTGLPTTLTINLPQDQSQVGDVIVTSGQAPPYSRVRVTINYSTRLITRITGQLWQGTVTTAGQGTWRTPEVGSSLGYLGTADSYTIIAELLDNNGNVVTSKQVGLRK
jgi:hypothetical protein